MARDVGPNRLTRNGRQKLSIIFGGHGIEPVTEGHDFPFFNRQNSDIFETQALLARSIIRLQLIDRPPESVR